ncbi:MAG: nucleoside triphosphate pyrophosphohydrolase [Firmicutes bacterium]|nr:nucleoside triphosphate pyrophosphohydrolase [Bacillota bacterium]
MRIVVVGLGPGPADLLTVRAERILREARRLFLRTRHHPMAETLRAWGVSFDTFDAYYESYPTFEEVYRAMATRLLEEARQVAADPVVYAVPGHPTVAERSVTCLVEMARRQGEEIDLELVPSPSGVEAVWSVLGMDPMTAGAALLDAHQLAASAGMDAELPPPSGAAWERRRGYLVLQLDSKLVAAQVKAVLGRSRGDEQPVVLVRAAGTERAEVRWLPLHAIARLPSYDHETSLYVPPAEAPEAAGAGEGSEVLARIMARLRAPDGCPWDRRQTPESLRRYIVEEAYEVCEAIESGDAEALREELGDLLLQVLFQAQIADEEGRFDLAGVERALHDKLVRRHPHVFGEARVKDAAEVLQRWEAIKRDERRQEQQAGGTSKGEDGSGLMAGVTTGLPSLAFAETVQRRAATVGFEWPDIAGAGRKAVEEARELREAWSQQDREAVHREMGDLLFAIVNVARYMRVDPELALRDATRRFMARFRRIERLARQEGRALSQMSLEELDALWEKAKAQDQGGSTRAVSNDGGIRSS